MVGVLVFGVLRGGGGCFGVLFYWFVEVSSFPPCLALGLVFVKLGC